MPVAVAGVTNATSVSDDGSQTFCAVLASRGVDCWGDNTWGQLGRGLDPNATGSSDVPVPVVGITDATNVSGGNGTLCAALTSGVDCWGRNDDGRLGAGLGPTTTPISDVPVRVVGITHASSVSADVNGDTFCALVSSSVDCWGSNREGVALTGQLGAGLDPTTTTYSDVSVAVLAPT